MQIEKVFIQSTKGNLAAVIHYPETPTDKLAILCPGFLDSKDYLGLVGLAEELAKIGYTTVRFDPTGTWDSEGDISEYDNTQYLEDVKNVLEYMLKQGDFQQVLLGGHSRGGMLSILYAARDQRITLILGIMPSSKRTMVGQRYQDWKAAGVSISHRDLPEDSTQKREFRVPFSHVIDREQYDVIQDVGKVLVPVILVAGELDRLVLPEHVQEIYKHANEPKKFIIIPGISHDYRHREQEVRIVNEQILEHLKLLVKNN
ncbi:MAG: alpha/beta hydrolase [bacterium]